MLGEVVSGLSIWDRLFKFWKNRNKPELESVATRFFRLFESHGVHRNQIPRFFGFNLTIADVKDDETLLPKLSEEMLDAACEMFAVRREWLDGAESQIHPEHDFYKYPETFKKFLEKLTAKNPDEQIVGVLIVPEEDDWDADALIILQETIGYIGDKPIYRFHLCNNWRFSYWKARSYLTACIAIAWKRNNYIHGIYKPKKFINELAYGETLLGWKEEGIWELGHKNFDPEYMALRVDDFLMKLEPEHKQADIKEGLKYWLRLNNEGFMDTGFGDHRKDFEAELAKYTQK